ncbi:MAG: helix-turn-helix domain-containing protein, partial [Candidatus Zixiibacteriota bacterium]
MDQLLTVEEIAEYLNLKPSTIYQWTHQGFIPHIKLGSR